MRRAVVTAETVSADLSLSLPEWVVLAVIAQQPLHGFAVVQLTAPGGALGRVWLIRKAAVYRGIDRLTAAGLVAAEGTQAGPGPQRTVYAATPQGANAARNWLCSPVTHIRDIRSELLLKLALADRAGDDPADLLAAQRQVLEPIARGIQASNAGCGFDSTLLAWRQAGARAALDFLDAVTPAARHVPARR